MESVLEWIAMNTIERRSGVGRTPMHEACAIWTEESVRRWPAVVEARGPGSGLHGRSPALMYVRYVDGSRSEHCLKMMMEIT